MQEEIERLVDEVVEGQRHKLLECARRYIPHLTYDDVLQPNDFPQLEHEPLFRYEEGIIEGMLTVRMALLAYFKDASKG